MQAPLISVILPVYNSSDFLEEAIDSIINQTYKNWELIAINDGSTDKSEDIILRYKDARIKYYKNEKNIGLIGTLNRGIDLSTGKYIARMDSDDVSKPLRFEKQINFMEQNPNYAMCGTFAKMIDQSGNKIRKIVHQTTDEFLKINLLFSVPFIHPSMMIKTSILKENKFDPQYIHVEDYDIWCRIARKNKVANIADTLLDYRWHGNNISIKNEETQNKLKSEINKRELGFLNIKPTEEELWLHEISFNQFTQKKKFDNFNKLENWFEKIIEANKNCKQYKQNSLIAFLWSRWILVCVVQKRFTKIYNPKFATYKPNVLRKLLMLLIFIGTKK